MGYLSIQECRSSALMSTGYMRHRCAHQPRGHDHGTGDHHLLFRVKGISVPFLHMETHDPVLSRAVEIVGEVRLGGTIRDIRGMHPDDRCMGWEVLGQLGTGAASSTRTPTAIPQSASSPSSMSMSLRLGTIATHTRSIPALTPILPYPLLTPPLHLFSRRTMSTWLSTPPFLPASLKALNPTPKLHLYTQGTPNGHKVSILLEELVLAYPDLAKSKLAYDIFPLSFDKKEQKAPEFLRINPNGRIPALVDDNVQVGGEGHKVFESASILLWLVENYDEQKKFWFDDAVDRSTALSWIFFGHGGEWSIQGGISRSGLDSHRSSSPKKPTLRG